MLYTIESINLSTYIHALTSNNNDKLQLYRVVYTANLRSFDITSRIRVIRAARSREKRGRVNPGMEAAPIMSQRRLNARRRHICLQSLAGRVEEVWGSDLSPSA